MVFEDRERKLLTHGVRVEVLVFHKGKGSNVVSESGRHVLAVAMKGGRKVRAEEEAASRMRIDSCFRRRTLCSHQASHAGMFRPLSTYRSVWHVPL